MGLAQAARQGIFAGISKTKVRYLGAALPGTWPSPQRERNKNKFSLECVAHDGAALESKSKLQVQVQRLQGNGTGRALLRAMCLCGTKRKVHRERASPAGGVPKQACEMAPGTNQKSLGRRALEETETEVSKRASFISWRRAKNKLARRLLALTRKMGTLSQRTATKAGNSANRIAAQNSSLGMGQENGRASSKRRPAPPTSAGSNFWTNALGQVHHA